jgi:hypothetical protein
MSFGIKGLLFVKSWHVLLIVPAIVNENAIFSNPEFARMPATKCGPKNRPKVHPSARFKEILDA